MRSGAMTDMPQPTPPADPLLSPIPPAHTADHRSIVQGQTPDLLERIWDPAVELVIWDRILPATLGQWLDSLPVHQMPHGRVLVSTAHVSSAVATLLDAAAMPGGAMRDAFLDDVVVLTELFMRALETDVVDIRLETIDHDACWKFHRDHVPARLLTTYRGPGTEWVHPRDSHNALTDQKTYQGPMERFSRYAVGLFKGNQAVDGEGIVHRSPPIKETGVSRLFLCLNLPSKTSPALWRPRQANSP